MTYRTSPREPGRRDERRPIFQPENIWAVVARREKADKMLAVLREQTISAANLREVMSLPDGGASFWTALEHAAKVRPSSRTTRLMVVEEMEKWA